MEKEIMVKCCDHTTDRVRYDCRVIGLRLNLNLFWVTESRVGEIGIILFVK